MPQNRTEKVPNVTAAAATTAAAALLPLAAGCWLPTAAYWLLLPLAAGDWLGAVLPYRIVVVVVRNCLLATIAADCWLLAMCSSTL